MSAGLWVLVVIVALLVALVLYDVLQKRHAIIRNFPIIGHFRYLLEAIGPELRQYIVTSNDEERPFSRDQRSWVYASSKKENNYFGFGTDNDLEKSPNYLIIKHRTFPHADVDVDPLYKIPVAKVIGGPRGRRKAFRPDSIVSVSAMSYGSLSANAVEALNRGCAKAAALHNTGEGGISPYHDKGAGLIYQLGTGYFGARHPDGTFSMDRLAAQCERFDVRAIEIKLSQGAKPGKGGILPAKKVTAEIAEIRHVERGKAVISPPYHTAFSSADGLLDFVEAIAERTGLPVGIKSAVGELDFWRDLARLMQPRDRGVDFIQIDGGEGGTGAAPLVFADHVSLPFRLGFARVYRIFAEAGLTDDVVFVGSGRLGFPDRALLAFGMGCDMISVAREAMLAVGCIQAQRCHTDHCPTGVATQNRWLMRGLDPTSKAERAANYLVTLRKEILWLTHACGYTHPAQVVLEDFDFVDEMYGSRTARAIFDYEPGWGRVSDALIDEVRALMPTEPKSPQEAPELTPPDAP